MRKIVTLFVLLAWVGSNFAQSQKTVDQPLAIKAVLNQDFGTYPAGTPVVVRGVSKPEGREKGGYVVVTHILNNVCPIGKQDKKVLTLQPETTTEFWQSVSIQNDMYEYFDDKGYRYNLRQELNYESLDYLNRIRQITYNDASINEYVQALFARLIPVEGDSKRPEKLSVRLIQSPVPDAYMLPNGVMLISTGLLSTLDSEEELTAIIANEITHYVLDHQVINVIRAESRSKRAFVMGTILAGVAQVSSEVAWYDNNRKAAAVSITAGIGSIASLASIQEVNLLGVTYNEKQEWAADQAVLDFLRFKGLTPDALTSALGKVKRFYQLQNQSKNLVRYGSCALIGKRLSKLNGNADINLQSRKYHEITANAVTFNAAMYQEDHLYHTAELLTRKNIHNGVASEHDYVINVQTRMAQNDTPESNEECLKLIRRAKTLSKVPNLDIYKQEALLLIRLDRPFEASAILNKYLELLVEYRQQPENKDDTEWVLQEMAWTREWLAKNK